jgi:hypothetical protein
MPPERWSRSEKVRSKTGIGRAAAETASLLLLHRGVRGRELLHGMDHGSGWAAQGTQRRPRLPLHANPTTGSDRPARTADRSD